MSAHPILLDRDDAVCLFGSRCGASMIGAGGLDRHHPLPEEFGGDPHQPLANACPNHHRRQHSLIRYLYDCGVAGTVPEWPVLRRFNPTERALANNAIVGLLKLHGGAFPSVASWPAPAARIV